MKGCELCGGLARMYCESDQASLCWDCDEKVHCANFLVAKHCRNLLCQVCQSPTPWKASGSKLGPTVSVCESCFSLHNNKNSEDREESRGCNVGENEYEEFDDDDDDDDDGYDDEEEEDQENDDGEEEEEDGENQVVPWSGTAASSPVPPVASSSSSEEEISSRFSVGGGILKRMRDNGTDLDSDDEIGCLSYRLDRGPYERLSNEEGNCWGAYRPLKQPRSNETEDHGLAESRSSAIIDSLKRLQRDMVSNRDYASATVLGICRLSRDQDH